MDADAYQSAVAPLGVRVTLLPGVDHMGVVYNRRRWRRSSRRRSRLAAARPGTRRRQERSRCWFSHILAHTPLWVWALVRVSRLSRTSPRCARARSSPYRVLIVPAVFFVWGSFQPAAKSRTAWRSNVAAFVAALLVGAAAGRALASLMPAPPPLAGHGTAGDAGIAGRLDSPTASPSAAKYVGAVALALTSVAAAHAEIASVVVAIGGLFVGTVLGPHAPPIPARLAGRWTARDCRRPRRARCRRAALRLEERVR